MPAVTTTPKKKKNAGGSIRTSTQNRLLPASAQRKKVKKNPANNNRRKKSQGKKAIFLNKKLVKRIVRLGLLGGVWCGIGVLLLVAYYSLTLPDISKLGVVEKKPNITIKNEKGDILATYGDLYGEYVTYKDFPPDLVHAVVATEDRRFFDHIGVDIYGLLRAAYANFKADRVVQGGSTITQQLAKIVFLTPDRTLERKVKEMILALWLEHKFSKEEILTIYLNRVYLGSGNYGVAAASRYYFGKDIRQINLSESAILAGLLKAPSRYSPANSAKLSQERAKQVLLNMADAGYISLKQAREEQQLHPASLENGVKESLKHPYFADWIMEQIPDYIGAVDSDITVKTTLDIRLQNLAEKSVSDILNANSKASHVGQAALVAMAPDGKILAMVGGRDYNKSQFNRAVKAERQPGSAFKLFVYLTALEFGYQPGSIVYDSPVKIKKWSPANYEHKYQGAMTLTDALAKSVNTVAVKLSEEAGRENVINMAHRLGIESEIEPNPSLALGASEVNLLELTRAYANLANNGMSVAPYGIDEIRDSQGHVIYQRRKEQPQRVLSEQVTADMNAMLSEVFKNGTGRGAQIGRPAAGKTGTSQDFHDAWLIGYTPDIVTGVWMGNDDNSAMNHVTGGRLPARIWREFMVAAHAGKPVHALPLSPYSFHGYREREDKSIWQSILRTFGGGSTAPDVEYTYPTRRRN